MVSGSVVALVTPFKADGSLDEAALQRLAKFQIEGGTDIIIPVGTTGESPSVSEAEHAQIVEIVVDAAKGSPTKVMAGAGSNSTHHAVHLTRLAEKAGAQGVLSVGPYYNKPTQEGYYQHFKAVAEATALPIIVYNVPGRTGGNINPDTLCRLASDFKNIAAVKEASANMVQITELLRSRPDSLAVLSGDDFLTLTIMAHGGDGIISVAANEVPKVMKQIVDHCFAGNFAEALKLHNEYLNLFTLNFIESNPTPVKYVMARMGLIEDVYRLPMVKISAAAKAKLDAEIARLGLVK